MNRKIALAIVLTIVGSMCIYLSSDKPLLVDAQSVCASKTRGDANCDTIIDENDYIVWRCEFLGDNNCSGNFSKLNADFNNDSKIDKLDFEIWRSNKFAM